MRMRWVALAAASFLSASVGCRKADPSFRVDVPQGWQVFRAIDDQAVRSKHLRPEVNGENVWIAVVCEPYGSRTEYLNVSRSLEDAGAKVVSSRIHLASDTFELVYAVNDEAGPMRGKIVIKPNTGRRVKTIMIQGIWPESRDAEMTKAFDAVAASADFR